MGTKAVRYLLLGQAILWLALLVSFVLLPDVVYGNQGISHFGIHARTILPYGLGFLGAGFCTLLASQSIVPSGYTARVLSRGLLVLALCLFAILLTPFSLSGFFDLSHMVAGAVLFSFEFALAAWLVHVRTDRLNLALLTAQFGGSALAAVSLTHLIELMITGQLIAEVAFGVLLIRTTALILEPRRTKRSAGRNTQ